MADIKTRNPVKDTIKRIDKSAIAAERMKSALVQTKENAEHYTHAQEINAEEYASNWIEGGADRIAHEAVRQVDKQGRKGLETTKQNVSKAKDGIQKFKKERRTRSFEDQSFRFSQNKRVKGTQQTQKAVKQSAQSTGKKTIKAIGKGSAKTAQKTIKTAEHTAKTTIKTTQQAAKVTQKAAQATVKAMQKAIQVAKVTAKAVAVGAKTAIKATVATIKAIIAASKALIAAIAAGGWIAVAVIIVICLIGLLFGSVFGIFFSGEDSGTGITMQTVVQEINTEYNAKLQQAKESISYDVLDISESRAIWKEPLAIYAVQTNTDPDNPQEVTTMDESKKQILKDIFWEMNTISSRTETKTETVITKTDDGHGNIVETTSTITQTYLYITVSHKTADEMATQYGFNEKQKSYLAELLADENNSLWSAVLYDISCAGYNYLLSYLRL